MQLKKPSPMVIAIAAATASLLDTSASAKSAGDATWEIETSALYYRETDDRVQDASISVRVQREKESGQVLVLGLTADTLTGATPTGAVPLGQPQTFTRPSDKGSYTTEAGALPTDDTFKDTRVAGYVSWSQPFAESWTSTLGLSFSNEFDYRHIGANAGLSKDFNRKNTVVNIGASFSNDKIDPKGGVPLPLSAMRVGRGDDDDDDDDDKVSAGSIFPTAAATKLLAKTDGSEDKYLLDLLIGITQVIDKNTIAQLNYSFSYVDGYQTDPYKFLTVLDGSTGLPVAGPDPGLFLYRFENRPEKRVKHSAFAKIKRFVGHGVFDISYRYMTDDWGIDSHTIDTHYRIDLSARHYIEPHVRWYNQSAADFSQTHLLSGEALPEEASADYRLADFTGLTVGIKFGYALSANSEISARLEWYTQSGNAKLTGVPQTDNVFPDLDAGIAQISYRYRF